MACLYLFFILQVLVEIHRVVFDTLANVKLLFVKDEAVLAGWIHYLVFDLFHRYVGSVMMGISENKSLDSASLLGFSLFIGTNRLTVIHIGSCNSFKGNILSILMIRNWFTELRQRTVYLRIRGCLLLCFSRSGDSPTF